MAVQHRSWVQESPVGQLTISWSGSGLTSVRFGATPLPVGGSSHGPVAKAFDDYFAGDLEALQCVPLDVAPRSAFAGSVMERLRSVAPGQLITYQGLAARAGSPGAARAVGSVMARNPVPIAVACHRVVSATAPLGGYAGGSDRKRWLLAHEGVPL